MSYQEFIRRSVTFIFLVVLTVLIVLLLIRIYPVLIIGFLAWVISVGLGVPVNQLRRRGVKRGTAILITFLGMALLTVLFVLLILPPIVQQTNNLLDSVPNAIESTLSTYNDLRDSSDIAGGLLPPFTMEDYRNLFDSPETTPSIDATTLAQSALPILADIGGFLGNLFINLLLIIIISIYFVIDPLVYYRLFVAITPANREARVVDILNKIRDTVVIWFGAMLLEVTITAVMVAFGLGVLLRIPNAAALGLLAGLGNIIPYIGYWAALVPIIIFALATAGPVTALLAFIVYFVTGIIEANVILPANIGSKLNLPAGLVLLFQAAAGALLGFFGILLAVPILAILKVLVSELYIYGALGKRGSVPGLIETPEGNIVLDFPPLDAEEDMFNTVEGNAGTS